MRDLEEHRQALTDRVAQRVGGSGIPRSTIERTVDRVLTALDAARGAPAGAESRIVAALAARSVPDLASRVRRDLESAGVVIEEMGIGAAGQHTVVTLRVPASARPALERLAERSRFSLSFLDNHGAPPA